MKVDRDVVSFTAQATAEREVRDESALRLDADVVQQRVTRDDWRGRWFNDVGKVRVGEALSERTNGRGRENNVANFAKPDEQDLQSGFDGRFVDEHHGNVIFNGIHAVTSRALERSPVLDERHRCFAVRTREDLEQLGVDGHRRTI